MTILLLQIPLVLVILASSVTGVVAVATPNSIVTEKAAAWLARCSSGNWDWSQFGPTPDSVPPTPETRRAVVELFRKTLAPFGEMRSILLTSAHTYTSDEGYRRTAYRYAVTMSRGSIKYVFALDSDGFVGGFSITTSAGTISYSR